MIDSARLNAVVSEAGRIALGRWPGAGHEVEMWEKEPGHPVCLADIEVDAFLKRELGALLPSAGWLSEETADNPARLAHDLVWLVDPIDGTRDFIRGRTGWAISVALVSNGRPLIGMLSAPARGEEWLSVAGQGATLNGLAIKASTRSDLSGARVPTDQLATIDSDLTMVEKPNSIALRMAMVADNRADLVATLRWGYEWDIGAATLIAREAGAMISDAHGEQLRFNKRDPRAFGVLVCAQGIHAAAVEHLSERAQRLATKG
ncbi:3'(2'),5'-bisphosphate nucleotidase CysQ [Altererythrobacter sp. GH1-8]|uniref:3'(2'),5'-bisphosphate nucleotidase CysQ n=1 Tax=Altererythrobacter sp. GH1-8 TaxID=3349333 RepID=UPI00374D9B51